jgi:hypothetical protein
VGSLSGRGIKVPNSEARVEIQILIQ